MWYIVGYSKDMYPTELHITLIGGDANVINPLVKHLSNSLSFIISVMLAEVPTRQPLDTGRASFLL